MTNQLPASLAAFHRPRVIIDDAANNLGASRGAHISIRGGRFRFINANGQETPVDAHHIDVVFIDANANASRVFFEGEYTPGNDDPPMCFSDNGVGPSNQSITPQAPTCAVCSHNIRGSATTFSGKASTACDNRKKMACVVPGDTVVNVYEFQIPPGSLSNLKAYTQWLRTQGSGVDGRPLDIADFVTRVAFDPDKQFVMTFTPVQWADDAPTLALIRHVYENNLSDTAVGRNDVAMDAEQVKLILAGGQRQAIVAPPARRGRTKQAETPASAPVAAPFMAPAAGPAPTGLPAPVAAPRTAASPSSGQIDTDIPDFLRRTPDTPQQQPAPQATTPPRFGVGQPPTPPAAIQDALNHAMNLPTRG